MVDFQKLVGFPEMGMKVCKVSMQDRDTEQEAYHEYVPAKNVGEAVNKAEAALKELGRGNTFFRDYVPVVVQRIFPRFDGGCGPDKWLQHGFAKESVPKEYVAACDEGGINLRMESMGFYAGCEGCREQGKCKSSSDYIIKQAKL